MSRGTLWQNLNHLTGPTAVKDRNGGKGPLRWRFDVKLVSGENRFEAYAATADGAWFSEPAVAVVRYDAPGKKVADARSVAELFKRRGQKLYEKVHVTPLLDQAATREGVKQTLKRVAAQTRPQDRRSSSESSKRLACRLS